MGCACLSSHAQCVLVVSFSGNCMRQQTQQFAMMSATLRSIATQVVHVRNDLALQAVCLLCCGLHTALCSDLSFDEAKGIITTIWPT